MPLRTRPFDAAEYLNTPERIEAYLNAVLDDGDPEEIAQALQTVARAHGLANKQGVVASVESLANPDLAAVRRDLNVLGFRLRVAAA